jgi:hypothetical protein
MYPSAIAHVFRPIAAIETKPLRKTIASQPKIGSENLRRFSSHYRPTPARISSKCAVQYFAEPNQPRLA